MMDLSVFLAFLPLALALNLTPGADMMFCLAQGMRAGSRPALAAAAGISTGGLVHVTLAGLGLGAVVAAYPPVFEAIRWFGVGYLLVLAWRTLRAPYPGHEVDAGDAPQRISAGRAFRDGLLVNLSNPKVILFILAFVPQFVDPTGWVLGQFLILGAVMAVGGMMINGAVGVFAGGLGQLLLRKPSIARGLNIVAATVFGALAMKLAYEARQ